jgi:hypothetical protein
VIVQTIGLSPKVTAAAIVGVIGWLLAYFAIPFDPKLEQALNVLASLAAAYLAPPGTVSVDIGEASDALLPPEAVEP